MDNKYLWLKVNPRNRRASVLSKSQNLHILYYWIPHDLGRTDGRTDVGWTDTSLRYRHWRMCFERLLQAFARWQPDILFDIAAQPILKYRWIDSYSQRSRQTQSKLQLSIRLTPSRCLDVRQDWYPMYYPEGMKARVSPVQSIEPHRILAPTRDSNPESSGPQSRVVTIILPQSSIQRIS